MRERQLATRQGVRPAGVTASVRPIGSTAGPSRRLIVGGTSEATPKPVVAPKAKGRSLRKSK